MAEPQSPKGDELAFLALLLRHSEAYVREDPNATEEERSNFYRAAGNYYRASREEIDQLAERNLGLEEIPVVLHLARCATAAPLEILAVRRGGRSWLAVMSEFNLTPEILYVPPVESPTRILSGKRSASSEPIARAAWNVLEFRDSDIVNLVNLKFISEYYGYRPEQVIALCSTGWTFTAIHGSVARPGPVGRQRFGQGRNGGGESG